tara:strand:- start:5775 stop:6329 length:555 start_codon:yes stop_codon:yes gene_type:complete
MDSVFKKYNVYEDVADIIAKEVHKGYQKEINKRIKIMIGFDWEYNYWNGMNTEDEIPNYSIYIWMDKYFDSLHCKELNFKEYEYMCNNKKVFSLNRSLRRNLFIINGNERIKNEIKDRKNEIKESKFNLLNNDINIENVNFLERSTAFLECKYSDWLRNLFMLFSISLTGITGLSEFTIKYLDF